jgi:eukaryotic-like serine/threonine-protein kinase
VTDANQHLMTIFSSALDHAAGANRDAFLDAACGPDPALRARVEGLLRAHEHSGRFLDPASAEPPPNDPPTGDRLTTNHSPLTTHLAAGSVVAGRYKLLEEIGEGGMGTVYMAEQTEPIQRKVALKVIKAGMDSRQVIARFEAERQALALMDHPNIARVIEASTTDFGRPYFVMELVKGVPITKYCDEHRLTSRQRLELFMPVCQAIQHAHQKGIIHRDIKPSNVLVAPYDGKPVVKVIDFGVAKAAGQRLTEKTLFTEFGAVVGTLEYMSPEQAELNNQDIDTRSDIYSLGVLLYELLTGTTPLSRERLKRAAFIEMLRMIREEEPPRPSTRLSESKESLPSISAQRHTEPAKLTRLVRGELDWIVMKALEKDRNRRYETASGFAADVQHYLADEQVLACPPSAMYRFRKFARRNKRALATGVLVGVALLSAVVGLAVSNWLIDRERAQTALERDRTEAANARLNANLWLAMGTLDQVYSRVGDWSARDPQMKKEYYGLLERMMSFYEQFAAQHGTDPHVGVNLARNHIKFGNLLLAGGERAKADKHYRRALDLLTNVVADCPGEAAYRERLAFTHFHLADLLAQAGKTAEAAEHYGQGFQIVKELALQSPREYSRCAAWNLATCVDPSFRDPAGAVQHAQNAAKLQATNGNSWTCLGIAHYRAGDWNAALGALEKATSLKNGGDSTDWLFLAMTHWRRCEKEQARKWYDQAIQPMPGPHYCLDPKTINFDRGYWFPVRYDSFHAEAADLLGIDKDQE